MLRAGQPRPPSWVNNAVTPICLSMDRYQLAYLLLILGLAISVLYSARTKEEFPSVVSEDRLAVERGDAVRLTYETGEVVELWLRGEEDGVGRLTVAVRAHKGSLVEAVHMNLTGSFSWLGLSTMRPLDGKLYVNESRDLYKFSLEGIGVPGADGLTVDFLLIPPNQVSIELEVDVRRGATLRHLRARETLTPP